MVPGPGSTPGRRAPLTTPTLATENRPVATALPFVKFFPADWLADERLRLCSLAARGLWVDMLCLMHRNQQRRGYLDAPDGSPLLVEQLARAVGSDSDTVAGLVAELGAAGVFSRDSAGVIYSRRMVSDEQRWARCVAAGKKGGNPALNHRDKGGDIPSDVQIPDKKEYPPNPPSGGSARVKLKKTNPEAHPLFARFWSAYPRRVGKPAAARAFARHDPSEELLAAMLAAIDRQRKSDQWTKDGGEFIPHPSTWLNQRRWEDTPADTPTPPNSRPINTELPPWER